jgi:hypothetical protein
MPSSQSDAVQSAVINQYKEMIFLPIETSGEGEINAHSRVQMALGEAKAKAKDWLRRSTGTSIGPASGGHSGVRGRKPEAAQPLLPRAATPGSAGVAANFVLHVGELMRDRPRRRQLREMPTVA